MTTRTEPRPAAAHVPPTPPPPAPAGMALTELLAALEGERRTHAAATRAGSTRQEATMREPTNPGTGPDLGQAMRAEHAQTEARAAELAARRRAEELGAHGASEPTGPAYGASFTLTPSHPEPRFPAMTLLDQELATLEEFHVPASINHLRDLAYSSAVAAGWHDPKLIEGVHREPSAGERVALIHEEATELLGHIRDGHVAGSWEELATPATPAGPDERMKPEGPDVELADIVIRCLDYAGRYGIDLGGAVAAKMRYNRQRAHRHGGRTL